MKRAVVWFAITLLALGTAAYAEQVWAVSNTFGIDNTAGATRPTPPSAIASSPYTDNAYQLRGQVHAHSLPDRSYIGNALTDNQFAALYSDIGYDFVAQTNHHNTTPRVSEGALNPAWSGWVPRSVEMTYGDGHLIVLGTAEGTSVDQLEYDSGSDAQKMAGRIRMAHDRQALAFIAHPSGPAYGVTVDELNEICRSQRPDAVSIYQVLSDAESKWDRLLEKYGQPIWAYSEDDYHPDALSSPWQGATWVQVPGNQGSTWYGSGGIKEQMSSGNYYISWITRGWYLTGRPPELRVSVDNSGTYPVVSAQVSNENGWDYTTWFKTDKGRFEGNQYPCTGSEKYVRVLAEVNPGLGRKIQIRSQPIWIDPMDTVGRAMRTPAGRGIASTSPELRLRYLNSSESPAPPDAGYISHAFDVTTDSGTCPPGATLDLSYDGADLSAIGGTQYLAIYRYDTGTSAWAKVGGMVDPGSATVSTAITALGFYAISADLPADTTAPEVFVDNPLSGGIVNMDTEVKATVNDDLGAYTVSFFMNDHPLAEDADALDGWSVTLPYADYCTGDWTLKAVAEDLAGNQGTAEIPIHIDSSTPRPTVSITSPSPGATVSGTVTATGTCSDDVAVALVSLYVDDAPVGAGVLDGSGGWTASLDTTHLANGSRTLTAVVEDYPGNEASVSVSVTVGNADSWHGLAMVSVPVIPETTDPKQVVAFEGNSWFAYRPEVGSYGVYPDHSTWFEPVETAPGRGFWARFGGEAPHPNGSVPPQNQPVAIRLKPGWNMIGNPFIRPVNWDRNAITVRELSGATHTLAASRSLVANYAWGWDTAQGQYILVYDPSVISSAQGALQPWCGYWIKALVECDLVIPAP